nr:MAG TPA: hypothetical protein [Caudoviricetes sp.]
MVPSKEFIEAIKKEKKRLTDEVQTIESHQPDAGNTKQTLKNIDRIQQEAREYKTNLDNQIKILGLGDDFALFINLQHHF